MEHPFQPREFIGIRLGYRDLFGEQSTWTELEADLKNYTLAEVLELLGRISAVVENAGHTDKEDQSKIAIGVFGPTEGPDLLERANRFVRSSGNALSTIFEPLQLLSLSKAALLLLPVDERLLGTDTRRLGTALLRMSDLIGPTNLRGFSTPAERQEWIKFLFATGIFYRGGSTLHDIARFHQLCLQPHKELVQDRDYLNLAEVASSATGLPVDLLWRGLNILVSHWKAVDSDRAPQGPVFLDEHHFLTANFDFTQEEQDRILSIATADARVLQDAVRREYSVRDFRPYDFVPLANKPLIRLGHHIYCTSASLLMEKLTTGLYYVLANSLSGQTREKFSRFLGHVFERYAVDLIARMFRPRGARVVDGDRLREIASAQGRKRGIKTADLVVVLDGIALVVETKARFFPRGARSGEDWAGISGKIDDIYSRGGSQLESTIEIIEGGALIDGFGVAAGDVKEYVPVVVCLDETPLTPPVYDLIAPVQPVTGREKTLPLQVMGVSELEPLEAPVARAVLNLHVVLAHKARVGRKADSLRNTIYREPGLQHFLSEKNPLLLRVYNESMQAALQMLQARRRS